MTRKLSAVALAMVLAACATAPQQSPAGGDMTDNEIAAIITALNEGEVMHGEIARDRALSSEVRAFAQMMVTDHTRALDTFSRQNIGGQESDLSRTLRSGAEQTAASLRSMSGADFDRNYMRSQLEMHDWALRSLSTTLIPSARDPQLILFLRDQRTAIAAHLERARQIVGGLP